MTLTKSFKKKLIAILLSSSMLFLSTTAFVGGETTDGADEEVDLEALAELVDEESLITEEEALSAMTLYAENDNFILYVNEVDMTFALKVKANDYIWWATPINADADPVAKNAQIRTMKSLFHFNSGDATVHRATKATAYDQSVRKMGAEVEKIANGAKFTFYFEKYETAVPLEITLTEKSLDVRIKTSEIKEELLNATENASAILDLSLLTNFGATGIDDEGYIFVADGSGAIINYNNNKTTTSLYKGQVYGRDYAISQQRWPSKTEQVYLPVIAMVNTDSSGNGKNALVGVAAEGDENAILRAAVAGQQSTSYNSVWFDFQLRSTDNYTMGGQNNQLTVYESGAIKTGDICVKYYPLAGENISYIDIANTYRDYLVEEEGLTKKTTANESPLFLTLDGGTMKRQSILGIPADIKTVGTSYSEAKIILEELKNRGIDDIEAAYNDFTKYGIAGKVSTGLDFEKKLGGKKDFNTLYDYTLNNNITLYPSHDFMEYFKGGNGFNYMLNSSKQVTKAIAVQTPYELAFGTATHIIKQNWTILSPKFFPKVFDEMIASHKNENVNAVSLSQATTLLYSDFSRINSDGTAYFNRKNTVDELTLGYQRLKDNGLKLLAQGANAYVLPYADMITNVPLHSSNYDIFDYDIPFYSMVIQGYIPYSAKPINASANAEELDLLSLSSGASVHYEMMYADPNDFVDSYYDHLYYANYDAWLDTAANSYKLYKDVLGDVSDKKIVDYKVIDDFIRETTYENGKTVRINIQTGEILVNGTSISRGDYGLKGESDYVS